MLKIGDSVIPYMPMACDIDLAKRHAFVEYFISHLYSIYMYMASILYRYVHYILLYFISVSCVYSECMGNSFHCWQKSDKCICCQKKKVMYIYLYVNLHTQNFAHLFHIFIYFYYFFLPKSRNIFSFQFT